jgi:hypothetical protein
MRNPIFKRLTLEDFKDGPAWLSRLFQTLNDFMLQTAAVLTGNITFGDNIPARSFNITVKTSSTYSTGDFETINITWPYPQRVQAIIVTQVIRENAAFTGSVGVVQWVNTNPINITYVPGLANSTTYSITFLVI